MCKIVSGLRRSEVRLVSVMEISYVIWTTKRHEQCTL